MQVDKFFYPVDFVVLDTQPVANPDFHNNIPVILGHPFLVTCDIIIHVQGGLLKLSFRNMTANLNMFQFGKQPAGFDDF